MLATIIDRLKSPVTITALVAGIADILLNLGVISTTDTIITVTNVIVGILITIGILNNPTDKVGF